MLEEDLAYVAGFLDGDGCLMAQLVKRSGYLRGYQIRLSIVFYQKVQNIGHLEWLKAQFGDGYIRKRNDEMAEYTIVGLEPVGRILQRIYPHLRLKRKLAKLILQISRMPRKLTIDRYLEYCRLVDETAKLTYSKKRTTTVMNVIEYLEKHKV
ncbi:MAG: LAGLIDADG family homing endonuclease [Patescibacteria group bacterium]